MFEDYSEEKNLKIYKMMKYFFCLISILSLKVSAQSKLDWINSFQSGQRIYAYGFEDYPTVKLFKEILADTNNVVIVEDDYFQRVKAIKNGWSSTGQGQSELCDGLDSILSNLDGVYSYNSTHENLSRDLYNFTLYNIEKYDSIIQKLGINKIRILEGNTPLEKQEIFIRAMAINFSFSPVDSLIFSALIKNEVLENEDFLKAGITKKIFFVRNYFDYNSANKFEECVISNSYLLIPRKGSKNLNGSNLNIRNPIHQKQEYLKLNFKDLPRILSFTRNIKIQKKSMKDFNFIYVNQLDNCFW